MKIKKLTIHKKTCQICGKEYPEHSLEIHHKDGNHLNNDLNNLEVWCTICHRNAHYNRKEKPIIPPLKFGGQIPCTKEDRGEFKEMAAKDRKMMIELFHEWIVKNRQG